MAASNSEKQSSKSSGGDGSSLSPSDRQKSSPASVDGGCSRWKYDVFLSFRGEDTRNYFPDHLYAALSRKGIITFRDDERLERGTEISSELTKAIEESRFSIVIFSKNYASSTRCLEGLAKIVECMETNNRSVIPVFYDIEPSEVRKQIGDFEKAFEKHEQNLDYNKVQRWRAALTEVSNIAGYNLSYDRPEAQCIEDIVDYIWRRLNIPFSNFSWDLVGMNNHLNMMNAYLEVESDDVRFLGIWGMGGIGKTTIARAVFEKISDQYEGSCFLGNIREGYERSGLVALQKQLLSQVTKEINLSISTVSEGIALIKRWLGRRRVLVVLDDVDDQLKQLNNLAGSPDWFGPKSRIIVTTRDEHVLKSHVITYIYKVGGLNHDDALQLFRMKAFKNKNPMDDHVNLSKHIVNYAHGIPLALEVLGSYLCDRTVEQWKSALDSLQENQDYPDGKILKVLRLSYDGLKQNEKNIFLDIACFFKGKKKDRVIEILDYCDFYSTIGMKVLVDKSLITISYNKLDMHDLLQEMGWEIVREQHRDDRGKWSRLWLFEDVHQVFADNRGTQAVEVIMLNKPKQKILLLDGKSFSNMSNLRLLKISNVDVSEDLIYLSNELRFFKWHGYPLKSLPSNFEAHKLFELNLCHSRIRYLWKDVKAFPKLKTVKLSYSHNLIETPDFTMVPNLEMLDLEGCTRLHKVHDSVGVLKSLTVLNLKGCKNLESFLSNLSGLKSLKSLNINGCLKLDKFAENLGELECLEELDAGGTAIRQVPSSIAHLSSHKSLFRHRVGQSCMSFFRPRRYFNSRCLLLPSLSGLCSLKSLDISDCNLLEGALPRDLGSLWSLKELNLSGNNFVTLPDFSQLPKLEMLRLYNCRSLESLPKLPAGQNSLRVEHCTSLKDESTALRGCTFRDIAFQLFNCLERPQNHGQENSLAVMLLKQKLQEKKSKILLAHENMSEVRESFLSGFSKLLEDMVYSPVVSDFFPRLRLKLNEKWLNGFKSNLLSLGWILGNAETKAYANIDVKVWITKLKDVSYDLEDLLDEIVTKELSDHQDKPRNLKIQNQGIVSAELSLVEIVIKQLLEEITVRIENLQRQSETLGLRPKASRIKREPCQLTVGRDCFEDKSHLIDRDEDKEAIIKLLLSDRTEASLKNKAYLQGPELEWSNVTVDCQNETGVLEQLEPHKNMEKLSIMSYGGTRFPNWLGDSSFFKMVFLCLSNCNSCSHLPPLGQLPSLKELKIEQMNGVKMVGPEFYGMNSSSHEPFPSLEILVFREMLEWEEWISPEVEKFPRPKRICISGCPKLAKLPSVFFPQSAEDEISECPLLVPVTDDLQLHDGNTMQFGSEDKVAGGPYMEEIQLPDSYGVQLKHESEIQLDRPSTSRLSEVKELQLPYSNVVQSTEVSVTSNRPTPESPTPLPEDSSAKHEAALDTSSVAPEISSDTDTDTDDAINVSEISRLKRLPRKLYSLKIKSCKALESLTEELMPNNLQQLYIIGCQYLKSIQARHLPIALKTLYIRGCKKLEFLSAEETTGKHTSVEHLCIESSCDPLKSFPLALFPKLRNLSISDCANFNSISITKEHMCLNSLEIQDCTNLESLSKRGLRTPKLTLILLSNCKKLKQLPGQLHGLTSLQSLFIKECPELDSIPVGGLPSSLNLLRISSCHKLTPCLQWGLHQLNKFIRFEIEGGCRDLESFPEQNLLPKNLNSLQFSRFPNLKVLNYEGLQHLTSLQTLKINSCDKLQFLPEEGLPSSLSYLYISDCPLLKSKLQNRRGSEWYKIANIPHVQIDGNVIS